MNAAMKLGPATELLAVYDADQRPRPRFLRHLTQAFGDARVAAAAGYRLPLNAKSWHRVAVRRTRSMGPSARRVGQ